MKLSDIILVGLLVSVALLWGYLSIMICLQVFRALGGWDIRTLTVCSGLLFAYVFGLKGIWEQGIGKNK